MDKLYAIVYYKDQQKKLSNYTIYDPLGDGETKMT